ncbi:MAG TPA: hypothetical protein VLU23_13085 [Pseudolabrys sp.]|nr:hypothetical protein [Pseudolabrys sp.]
MCDSATTVGPKNRVFEEMTSRVIRKALGRDSEPASRAFKRVIRRIEREGA